MPLTEEEANDLAESQKLEENSRAYIRTRITNLDKRVKEEIKNITKNKCYQFYQRATTLKSEIDTVNKSLLGIYCKLELTQAQLKKQLDSVEKYDDTLSDLLADINLKLSELDPPTSSNQSSGSHSANPANRKLRLPEIPLPTFSNHKHESYRNFRRSFEGVISKHDLTSYEKFVYLRNQLSKGPRKLVDSLDPDQQTYEVADKLLKDAFDDSITCKYELIKRLSELKLELHDDPYSFIGNMRSIISSIDSFQITTKDFQQYYVWNALNDKFQEALINITNKTKPSLEDITTHIFDATNRYKKQVNSVEINKKNSKSSRESVETNISAVNVKNPKFCPLCKADGAKDHLHDLRLCPKYDTPSKKVNRLKALNYCIKCGFQSHNTSSCHYKFSSKCRTCDRDHMSFLCLKSSSRPPAERQVKVNAVAAEETDETQDQYEEEEVEETLQTQSLVEVLHTSGASNVALPTFTATLVSNNITCPIRAFKDGGSQKNFISHMIKRFVPSSEFEVKS